jgi:hypothetical protein
MPRDIGLVAEALGLSLNLRAWHHATGTCQPIYPTTTHESYIGCELTIRSRRWIDTG